MKVFTYKCTHCGYTFESEEYHATQFESNHYPYVGKERKETTGDEFCEGLFIRALVPADFKGIAING